MYVKIVTCTFFVSYLKIFILLFSNYNCDYEWQHTNRHSMLIRRERNKMAFLKKHYNEWGKLRGRYPTKPIERTNAVVIMVVSLYKKVGK